MKVLLDTHPLLWWLTDSPKLSAAARDAILKEEVLVSTVSLWEIEIKRSIGRLEADVAEIHAEIARTSGFNWLDVKPQHVLKLGELQPHHKDPFDRLLVSQALYEGATLISKDASVGRYTAPVLW